MLLLLLLLVVDHNTRATAAVVRSAQTKKREKRGMSATVFTEAMQAWLAQNGPLSDATVLDYFRWCPYYDLKCVNEVLLSQQIEPTPEELSKRPGKSYERVGDARAGQPGVFVLREVTRDSDLKARDADAYYVVVDGAVTPAPTLRAAVSLALRRCLHHTAQAFDELASAVRVDPVAGLVWDPMPDTTSSSDPIAAATAQDDVSSPTAVREQLPPPPLAVHQELTPEAMRTTVLSMLRKIDQFAQELAAEQQQQW